MIEEGFNTESQRQMQFAQLVQLREMGIQIPDSALLETATIQNKDKILQQMEQEKQQAQQIQQQQLQMQMQEAQSRIQLAQSRAISDEGLGLERVSRVDENKALGVERRAKAVADDNMALLNFVRAMKEIENIDITHLQQIVSIQQMLKAQEQVKEDKVNNPTITNNPQPTQNSSGPA